MHAAHARRGAEHPSASGSSVRSSAPTKRPHRGQMTCVVPQPGGRAPRPLLGATLRLPSQGETVRPPAGPEPEDADLTPAALDADLAE
jgi:hypothetical protein